MAQVWIEIDDNENCGYYPIQTFEMLGPRETGSMVAVSELPGREGPQEVVGWCSEYGGTACEVTVVLIGDSGAGQSRLIKGGDHGVRIRPAGTDSTWSLDDANQHGEPYVLLGTEAEYSLTP